jgi:hypothetical protein
MVSASTFWWNSFPPVGGVSGTLSPRAIVAGMEIDFLKYGQLEFGTYVQTLEQSDNTMQSRTTGAIAMRPTGNEQGGYYFFSLSTGQRLNRNRWTKLPMPNEVVDRVHLYAHNNERGLTFGTRNGLPNDNDPFDSDGESYDDGDDSDDGADNESVEYDSKDSDYSDEDDDVDPVNTNLPITGVTENMVPVPQQNVDPREQNVDPRDSDLSGSDESYLDHNDTSEDPTGYDSPDWRQQRR